MSRLERISLLVTAAEGTGQPTLSREALKYVTPPGRIDGMSVVSLSSLRSHGLLRRERRASGLMMLARAVAEPLYRERGGV